MNTGKYTKLEIFAKALQPGGSVLLISGDGECQVLPGGKAYYKWIKALVDQNTEYEILPGECEISLCYLSGCENILEEGVCYLEQDDKGRFIKREETDWYNSPIREAYHFTPSGDITICSISSTLMVRSGPICTGDMRPAGI